MQQRSLKAGVPKGTSNISNSLLNSQVSFTILAQNTKGLTMAKTLNRFKRGGSCSVTTSFQLTAWVPAACWQNGTCATEALLAKLFPDFSATGLLQRKHVFDTLLPNFVLLGASALRRGPVHYRLQHSSQQPGVPRLQTRFGTSSAKQLLR